MTNDELPCSENLYAIRERMIREGHIVPFRDRDSVKTAFESLMSIKEKIDRQMKEAEQFLESFGERRTIRSMYERFIEETLRGLSAQTSTEERVCRYFHILKFLSFSKTIKKLIKRNEKSPKVVVLARDGFFFAFKENMKNTP